MARKEKKHKIYPKGTLFYKKVISFDDLMYTLSLFYKKVY